MKPSAPAHQNEAIMFRKPLRAVDGIVSMAYSVRATGSRLPILVINFANEQSSHEACMSSNELKVLNVTCYLSESVNSSAGYGYAKIAAVSVAPAREILWIDQDAWFTSIPDRLFDDTGYAVTGALFWPDLFDFFHKDDQVWEYVGCGPDGRLHDCELCLRTGLIDLDVTNCFDDNYDQEEEDYFSQPYYDDHYFHDDSFFVEDKDHQKKSILNDELTITNENAEDAEFKLGITTSTDIPQLRHELAMNNLSHAKKIGSAKKKTGCLCPKSVTNERWNDTASSEEWTTFSRFDWAARQGFDTGIFILDKAKVGRMIELTDHLARIGDDANTRWAKYSLGDKDLWHLAWMVSGKRYALTPFAAMVGGGQGPTQSKFLLVSQAKCDDSRNVVVLHQNWRGLSTKNDTVLATLDLRYFEYPPFNGYGADFLKNPIDFSDLMTTQALPKPTWLDDSTRAFIRIRNEPPRLYTTSPAPNYLLRSLAQVRQIWEHGHSSTHASFS